MLCDDIRSALEDPLTLFEQLDADGGGELSLQDPLEMSFTSGNVTSKCWQELDDDAALVLHHFQEFTVLKYKRGVEDLLFA